MQKNKIRTPEKEILLRVKMSILLELHPLETGTLFDSHYLLVSS